MSCFDIFAKERSFKLTEGALVKKISLRVGREKHFM